MIDEIAVQNDIISAGGPKEPVQNTDHEVIISAPDMDKLSGKTLLLDIRDEETAAYGIIPGAKSVSVNDLDRMEAMMHTYDHVILYCTHGTNTIEPAEHLRSIGINAYSLKGGYNGWLLEQIKKDADEDYCERVEKGIRKRYHKKLFSPFAKAINTYKLVQENDKIAVCISGGKDSMLMAKLFQELQRHRKFPFELVFLVMDPGYSEANRKVIEHNAEILNIPLTIFESEIFDIVYDVEKSPCYLCARMRRGHLYSKAKELGCNKIALGHHYDDVIETILMGMLYGGQIQTMMPKLHSTNFEGMELIRPMYLIREADIKRWRDENGLHFIQCACRFTDTCTTCEPDGRTVSKRMEVKQMIAQMKKINPYVESNIFKSVENVSLDTVIAYKKKGKRISFLDEYEQKVTYSDDDI